MIGSDVNDRGSWSESPQVFDIARNDDIVMLSGQIHNGSIDDIGGARSAAEFSARP